MTVAVSTNVSLSLTGNFSDTVGLGSVTSPPVLRIAETIATATAALVYTLGSTAITGTENVIDLTGGTLKDPGGNLLTFDKIMAVGIKSAETSNANMVVTVADINTANDDDTIHIFPGGSYFWFAPLGCDATVGNITITGTATDTYQIFVVGSVA